MSWMIAVMVVLGGAGTWSPDPYDPHEEYVLLMEIASEIEERRAEEARQAAEEERRRAAEAEATKEPPRPARSVWDRLAECESGDWVNGGASFVEGSARWHWGAPGFPVPPWGTTVHHGGLQFHPSTWDWLKPTGYPTFAYEASREQQIAVAERVLEVQGWRAWPVCSRKLGLR